jgi:uncharacterized OB-fold protein
VTSSRRPVIVGIGLRNGPVAPRLDNVTGCAPEDVHIGMPVEAYTIAVDDGLGVPFWRPAGTG